MAKPPKTRHDWKQLEKRFVDLAEWPSYAAMWRALKAEADAKGTKCPTESMIRARARREHWAEKRLVIDQKKRDKFQQQVIDKDVARLMDVYERNSKTGRSLIGIGAGWIAEVERLAAEARARGEASAGAVTSLYEALALIRAGAGLEIRTGEGIARLQGVQGVAGPARGEGGAGEDDGVQPGLVVLPGRMSLEEWEKDRRKTLEAPIDLPDSVTLKKKQQ